MTTVRIEIHGLTEAEAYLTADALGSLIQSHPFVEAARDQARAGQRGAVGVMWQVADEAREKRAAEAAQLAELIRKVAAP